MALLIFYAVSEISKFIVGVWLIFTRLGTADGTENPNVLDHQRTDDINRPQWTRNINGTQPLAIKRTGSGLDIFRYV